MAPVPADPVVTRLCRLCERAVTSLPAAGAGLSVVAEDNQFSLLAAADAASERLEELQFVLGEGPCVDAAAARRPVLVADLGRDGPQRWPVYAGTMRAAGIGAIFAIPLQVGAAQLGVLDLFRTEPGSLSGPELGRAFALADEAVAILLDDRARGDGEPASGTAMAGPVELFQAQGMAVLGVERDKASDAWEAAMTTVSAERLSKIFVEVADTLVDDFDLQDFLHMLTVRTAGLVGASAVGLLLADGRGQLRFMAASDERARILEIFQVQASEGPCHDAFRSGEPVLNADLRDAVERWPDFTRHALAAGFRSVHAFPMRVRREVIGALNVFGSAVGGNFDEADVQIVQALTDVAAIALLQERAIRRGELLTEQLQGALNSRILIEQAKGAIAQAHGISVDQAFAALRGHARSANRKLTDVAQEVLSNPDSLTVLTQH